MPVYESKLVNFILRKNVQYQIVKTMTWKGLVEDVNKLIQKGWIPQGGISEYNGKCFQAMIKK